VGALCFSPGRSRRFTPPLTPPRQGEGNRFCRAASGVLVLSAAILCAFDAAACPPAGDGFARLASAEAEIAYRWEPSDVKVGKFFEAEVVACRAPGGEVVREIVIDAQMPAHGHGMNYRPAVTQMGPGRFRITGLMLHMPGMWRLSFDLIHGETRTRLTRDVTLKP